MNWKKIIGWTAGTIFGLLLIAVIAGYLVLRSEGFHKYLLAKIEQQGNEATGGKVEVQNFDFQLSSLTAHLYGFTIHGTEPASEAPLLRVDKLSVGLKILSVLRQEVNLSDLVIEHPVAHFVVDKGGRTNLPQPNAPKNKNSQTNVFDLAVGHVLLSNGEVDYNDRKLPLDADVRDLRAETHFSSLSKSYDGTVAYHDGHVKYAGMKSLSHALNMQFGATESALNLPTLVLTLGSSRISLQATVNDYSNPKVDGSYGVLIHGQDLAGLAAGTSADGDVSLSGKLAYQAVATHPFIKDVIVNGQVESGILKILSPQAHFELRQLTSHYSLANANFKTSGFAVNLLHGNLKAELAMQHLDAESSGKVRAALSGISLQAAAAAANASSAKTVPVDGNLQGTAEASWSGSVKNLLARADLNIRAATTANGGGVAPVPVNGVVHFVYDGPRNIVTVRQTTISTPKSSLLADGQISGHSNLSIHGNFADLHELAALAVLAQPPKARSKPSPPVDLSGAATLNATVTGPLQNPQIAAQLNGQNLVVDGSEWRRLALTAHASPSAISIQNGSLINAQQGQLTFSAKAGLRNWSYRPTDAIAANISVKQMPMAQIERLARLQYPVDGNLSGDIALRGSQLNPEGSGSLQLSKARVANEPIQNLAAKFDAANGTIHSTLNVDLPAGSVSAQLTFIPKTKSYKFKLDAPGIVLSRLQTVQARNLALSGMVTAAASGEGKLNNPQLSATIQLPKLQLRENSITGVKAEINVANQRANLLLSTDVMQSTLRARATVNLTGDYYADAAIDTTSIPLEPLLAMFVANHPAGFKGATELHATLKGPLKDKTRIEAHVVIPTLTASYQALQVGNTGPIRMDYANSVVVLQPSEIKGTDSELRFQGRVPIVGTDTMTVSAKGSVDLRLLQIISPDLKSSGTINLDVNTRGTTSHPTVQGQIQLKDASLSAASAPLGLSHANGTFDVGTDQVRITQFTGQVGGGDISAGGTITYRPQVLFNVAMQARSVRLLYPEGLRTVLSSDLGLSGNINDAALEGRVLIDSLSFTPDFDMSSFIGQFSGASVPPTGASFADNIKLNVSIQSTGQLTASSSQVSLQGQANLRAVGTASNPVIVGRADLNSGDVFFLNNRYQLQRGVFTFNNPNQTETTVNMAAATTIQQYNLTINVNGPLDKLQTSYVSDPPLSTVDIINLIARGQTTQQADTTNLSANSLIAQGVAGRLSSGVQKLAGLSSLSIDPLLGGNNTNPSARIAVQQRLTKNFFFTFSTDVTQPQSEVVQGEYQINRRWSVSANRDAGGGVAVDGKYHTSF